MAKKTRKRSRNRSRRTGARRPARKGKGFTKKRSNKTRGAKRSRRTNSRPRGQTIRLVIEQAPQESSLNLGRTKPKRKARF